MSRPLQGKSEILGEKPYFPKQKVSVRFTITAGDSPVAILDLRPACKTFSPGILYPKQSLSWLENYTLPEKAGEVVLGEGQLFYAKDGIQQEEKIEGAKIFISPCLDIDYKVETLAGQEHIFGISLTLQNNSQDALENSFLEIADSSRIAGGYSLNPIPNLRAGEISPPVRFWIWGKEDFEIFVKKQSQDLLLQKNICLRPLANSTGLKGLTEPRRPMTRKLIDSKGRKVKERNVAFWVVPGKKYFLTLARHCDENIPIRAIHFKEDNRILFVKQGNSQDQNFEYDVYVLDSTMLSNQAVIPLEIEYQDNVIASQTIAFFIQSNRWALAIAVFLFGFSQAFEIIFSPYLCEVSSKPCYFRTLIAFCIFAVLFLVIWVYDRFHR
ncbi:MAG: hypothetical protein HUU50_01410 [Candidatus Brocadiae bacterium]|nr:hypothetical protein [Candidatus Brocadiia bacterium]